MKVVCKEEMEQIDRETSEEYLFPSSLLMENAGIAIAQKILELYPELKLHQKTIAILVGPGNNGGDGLVIARYFYTHEIPVHIYIIGKVEKFKGDPLMNLNIATKLAIPITIMDTSREWLISNKTPKTSISFATVETVNEWQNCKEEILACPFMVDALFGTGLKGEVREQYKEIILDINNSNDNQRKIIAVDVPSGLLSIEDKQNEHIIKADDTITVALPKIGMIDYPGKSFVEKLHIVQIGFPDKLLNHERIKHHLISSEMAKTLLPKREPNSHKGSYGHLLVIGGSNQYTGAAILACQAALRTGCGLVTLASVPYACQTLRNHFPEAINWELPETAKGTISDKAFEELQDNLSMFQAVVFGPGIGQNQSTARLLQYILTDYQGKILIDADGLNLLSQNISLLKETKASIILTPHIKEMARLTQKNSSDVIENKIALCREFSTNYNVTTVLKSAVTLIAHPDAKLYSNSTGNEGMASGGTGDVLAGMIGAFMCQGLGLLESGILGVYMHGLSGDLAKNKTSSASLIASDLISTLHLAFQELAD